MNSFKEGKAMRASDNSSMTGIIDNCAARNTLKTTDLCYASDKDLFNQTTDYFSVFGCLQCPSSSADYNENIYYSDYDKFNSPFSRVASQFKVSTDEYNAISSLGTSADRMHKKLQSLQNQKSNLAEKDKTSSKSSDDIVCNLNAINLTRKDEISETSPNIQKFIKPFSIPVLQEQNNDLKMPSSIQNTNDYFIDLSVPVESRIIKSDNFQQEHAPKTEEVGLNQFSEPENKAHFKEGEPECSCVNPGIFHKCNSRTESYGILNPLYDKRLMRTLKINKINHEKSIQDFLEKFCKGNDTKSDNESSSVSATTITKPAENNLNPEQSTDIHHLDLSSTHFDNFASTSKASYVPSVSSPRTCNLTSSRNEEFSPNSLNNGLTLGLISPPNGEMVRVSYTPETLEEELMFPNLCGKNSEIIQNWNAREQDFALGKPHRKPRNERSESKSVSINDANDREDLSSAMETLKSLKNGSFKLLEKSFSETISSSKASIGRLMEKRCSLPSSNTQNLGVFDRDEYVSFKKYMQPFESELPACLKLNPLGVHTETAVLNSVPGNEMKQIPKGKELISECSQNGVFSSTNVGSQPDKRISSSYNSTVPCLKKLPHMQDFGCLPENCKPFTDLLKTEEFYGVEIQQMNEWLREHKETPIEIFDLHQEKPESNISSKFGMRDFGGQRQSSISSDEGHLSGSLHLSYDSSDNSLCSWKSASLLDRRKRSGNTKQKLKLEFSQKENCPSQHISEERDSFQINEGNGRRQTVKSNDEKFEQHRRKRNKLKINQRESPIVFENPLSFQGASPAANRKLTREKLKNAIEIRRNSMLQPKQHETATNILSDTFLNRYSNNAASDPTYSCMEKSHVLPSRKEQFCVNMAAPSSVMRSGVDCQREGESATGAIRKRRGVESSSKDPHHKHHHHRHHHEQHLTTPHEHHPHHNLRCEYVSQQPRLVRSGVDLSVGFSQQGKAHSQKNLRNYSQRGKFKNHTGFTSLAVDSDSSGSDSDSSESESSESSTSTSSSSNLEDLEHLRLS